MLDFRMETFFQVCHFMNFTKAAEVLNITQPAVSQHIRYLENYYETKLLRQEGKKLKLTEAGKMLYKVASTMIHDEANLKKQILNLSNALEELRFGATKTVGEVVMPEIISRYLKDYPDSHIYMKVTNTTELLKCLEDGKLDFALVEGYFKKSDYDCLHYSTEKYVAVCCPDYPFKKKIERIEDLFEERLLAREPGSGTREVLERYLEAKNCSVDNFSRMAEIGSLHAIKELAKSGCGIAFLYEVAVKEEIAKGELMNIDIPDFNVCHDFNFIWRKGSVYSDIYHTLFQRFLDTKQ